MHVLESLYSNCVGYICLSGRLYNGIDIQSGVKQGDPSSMTLFILGYDPILRWIAFRISPLDGHMFGMCDDLAMTVNDVSKAWDMITVIFDLVLRFASLSLNQPKTQILLACPDKFPKQL